MKKLRTIVFILLASLATTSVIAAGSDFAGPYLGLRVDVAGAHIDGNAKNSNAEVTDGNLGSVFAAQGWEAGYTLPVGDSPAFVSVGASWMSGAATIIVDSGEGNASGAEDVTIEIKDHWTAYIAPGFALSDTAAMYFKAGYAQADVSWEGDIQQGPKWIEGYTGAIGTRAMTAAGLFVQTEAGFTSYDDVHFTKKTGTGHAAGDPMIAYGAVTVGMKF